jgi:hypothetical protein
MVEQSLMMIQFDGFWGIWDEPFLIYENTLDKRQRLFFICFHSVFMNHIIFKRYKSVLKEGGVPIHKCAEYTDFALKRFYRGQEKPWFDNTILSL